MEVILKEDVPKLGSRGEVVKVAEGYGRNFLLPKKLAIQATEANKTVIEQMKAASVRRSAKEKSEAEALAKQFDGLEVKFTRKSGEGDHLFGSVTAGDIAVVITSGRGVHEALAATAIAPLTVVDMPSIDERLLLDMTYELGATLLDPVKTTNVQNQRCMTTWVLQK